VSTNKTTSQLLKIQILVFVAVVMLAASCTAAQETPGPSAAVAAPPPHPGTIAFARTAGGQEADIYVIQTDGTGLALLADGPGAWLEHPAWSPDGTRIAYHSGSGFNQISTYSVWAINADGTEQQQLTRFPVSGLWPAWSLDGTQIALSAYSPETNTLNIAVMNADGSDLTVLTSEGTNDLYPTWAPNGAILFLRTPLHQRASGDVFAVNPDGGEVIQLTTVGPIGGYALSPDGTKIAFQDVRNSEIAVVPTDASGAPVTLVNSELGCPLVALSWSPDGQALAIACSDYFAASGSDLYIVNADGSGLTTVPNTGSVFDPAWGPG
jgi:Tol biopolymer transport system component